MWSDWPWRDSLWTWYVPREGGFTRTPPIGIPMGPLNSRGSSGVCFVLWLRQVACRLLDLCLDKGSKDNMSVVIYAFNDIAAAIAANK